MLKHRPVLFASILVFLLLALSACGPQETVEPTESSTEEPTEEITEEPTATSEPTATLEPTATPVPILDETLDPVAGNAVLESRFSPDPQRFDVEAGGIVDTSYIEGCSGWATGEPTAAFEWTGNYGDLRVFFDSDYGNEDAALIIHDPSGNWTCNDNMYEMDPGIVIEEAPSGTYSVWVSSIVPDFSVVGKLFVTRRPIGINETITSIEPPNPDTPTLDWSLAASNGDFVFGGPTMFPDPIVIPDVVAGGGFVDPSRLGLNGSGYFTEAPAMNFYWFGESAPNYALVAQFVADEPEGTEPILLVRTPDDRWFFGSTASEGTASVDLPELTEGWYSIWAGQGDYGEDGLNDEVIPGTIYLQGSGWANIIQPQNAPSGDVQQWAMMGQTFTDQGGIPIPEIIGPADTSECGNSRTAAASSFKSDGTGTIWVLFETPVIPTRIDIYVSNYPGGITSVGLFDVQGRGWSMPGAINYNPQPGLNCPEVISLFPWVSDETEGVKMVDFLVNGLSLSFDNTLFSDPTAIDAIQLHGYLP